MPLQVTHNKNINWGGQLLKVWIKCEEVYQCVAIKFYGVTYCEFRKLFLFCQCEWNLTFNATDYEIITFWILCIPIIIRADIKASHTIPPEMWHIRDNPEAVFQRCSVKKGFLEISQNSQENTCARVSF